MGFRLPDQSLGFGDPFDDFPGWASCRLRDGKVLSAGCQPSSKLEQVGLGGLLRIHTVLFHGAQD